MTTQSQGWTVLKRPIFTIVPPALWSLKKHISFHDGRGRVIANPIFFIRFFLKVMNGEGRPREIIATKPSCQVWCRSARCWESLNRAVFYHWHRQNARGNLNPNPQTKWVLPALDLLQVNSRPSKLCKKMAMCIQYAAHHSFIFDNKAFGTKS